ncbi:MULTISPECIES: ribonuclease III [Aestuariimicrobium]|uniref:ribonuclease III n=1 Tax=Aestuariimicrobium TaxID=396388 RepID=UPI000A07369A|nr:MULTISPECIES: ribonuclease III [Aestuariimicrobium]
MDAQLLELALTHRSWAYENGGVANNERLEFLGDAVLGVVVTEHLYVAYPDEPEGRLAKIRAATVNANTLADVARGLQLGPLIKLGKGEIATGGDDKTSILADTMEALIGAALLSGTRETVERLVRHLFVPIADQASTMGAGLDWKTSLQELAARSGWTVQYEVTETGPDHNRQYSAAAVIHETTHPVATGRSKREAEIGAARLAYLALNTPAISS